MIRSHLLSGLVLLLATSLAAAQSKPYRLPSVDLKQPVIWGSEATTPEGFTLAFGGLMQAAPDGSPHTRIRLNNNADLETLKFDSDGAKSLLALHAQLLAAQQAARLRAHAARHFYLEGAQEFATSRYLPAPMEKSLAAGRQEISAIRAALAEHAPAFAPRVDAMLEAALKLSADPQPTVSADLARRLFQAAEKLDQAAALVNPEPGPRALSPLVYDPGTKLFILFGGDHLDYLTNDVWVFDPANLTWKQRHQVKAPRPRANHTWEVLEPGKLRLSGGYTYVSNTDYMGGQYVDWGDGDFVYDVAANTWSGEGPLVDADARTYRSGPFHPDFYLQGERPDAAAFQKQLSELPANQWWATKPPHLPHLNRDWGSAVLAPECDLLLRWSGGHCAHGGTDVLHYHLASNRWELTAPVEFPLGQLYTNTEYPAGVSFNRRVWITGHTYQNYGYDQTQHAMYFVGQSRASFPYSPWRGDWLANEATLKPNGMNYNSCFYTLTLTNIGDGSLVCWTNEGRVFHRPPAWQEMELAGDELPGSIVDNSTLTYDSQRNKLYFFRKKYGDSETYDGVVHALDLKTKTVTKLTPDGADAAHQIPYLCQIRYDAASDLLLCGCTLPPDASGLRRTPAYDPKHNRWVSLKITGDDPSGERGRNVSLGMMYDAQRKLFWAVDTKSQVYVLRVDPRTADVQPLK
jgi:hypothetical protein